MRQDEYWDDVGVTLNRKDPHQYALAPASYFAADALSEGAMAAESTHAMPTESAVPTEDAAAAVNSAVSPPLATPTRAVGLERRPSPVSDRHLRRVSGASEAGGAGEAPMSLQQV